MAGDDVPVARGLHLVMVGAERAEVPQVGWSACVVGDRVVDLAAFSGVTKSDAGGRKGQYGINIFCVSTQHQQAINP